MVDQIQVDTKLDLAQFTLNENFIRVFSGLIEHHIDDTVMLIEMLQQLGIKSEPAKVQQQ